jgi:uncharacterized membrane protein YsdA (DUF1294 family)
MVVTSAVLAGLALVNVRTFIRFGQDKARARAGERRIAEADLLGLAIFGGTPGAFLARHVFRHKTRKQPFSTYLYLIGVVQTGLVAGFLLPLPF